MDTFTTESILRVLRQSEENEFRAWLGDNARLLDEAERSECNLAEAIETALQEDDPLERAEASRLAALLLPSVANLRHLVRRLRKIWLSERVVMFPIQPGSPAASMQACKPPSPSNRSRKSSKKS